MLRLLITLPFLAALIVFAIYNQEMVTLSVPGYSRQSSLAVLVMVVAVVFFLIGGLSVWFAELRQRRRARRAEQALRTLETQVSDLKLQLAQAVTENHMAQQGRQQGYASVAPSNASSHALPPPSSAA